MIYWLVDMIKLFNGKMIRIWVFLIEKMLYFDLFDSMFLESFKNMLEWFFEKDK